MQAALAVCLGACAGALLRWRVGAWLNQPGAWLPWGTLAVNALGAYWIGVAIAFFEQHPHIDPAWRLLLISGFLGALTTFSTFSAEVVQLLLEQQLTRALSAAALHVLGSLALTVLGIGTVRWLSA